jgi:hypothetical protein
MCLSVLVVCRGLSGVGSVSIAECNVMSLPVVDVDSDCQILIVSVDCRSLFLLSVPSCAVRIM